jgi:5'-phosphate synthase pdxT subunit
VERNAYGSQVYSRVVKGSSIITDREFSMVFIRAPKICSVPENVKILAELDGDIVAVRQRNILLTTFHPELTEDSPMTEYFLKMASNENTRNSSFKAGTGS